MERNYRTLRGEEISALEMRGCRSADWSQVEFLDDTIDCSRLRNVEFSGRVRVGRLGGEFRRAGGVICRGGIYDATLHDVTVGDDVYINRVSGYIANYDIADGAYIDNVNRIYATLDSSFGVGTEVSVLNETGGREVPIYDGLSAHTAYLIAMYRHETAAVDRLCDLIRQRAESLRGHRGRIGEGAELTDCGAITDVMIGACARIYGVTRLKNGTIVSNAEAPVRVGDAVIAEGFIFCSGSRVDDGAVVHHCYVGQASVLSHLFSAHDSLFFANCNCENGEAAAIFGGPYTVTAHKSSLLIAGYFSFINAGSGSNQSNHMYKLGPIHQGIIERGSKTTSDSYILWPARIGAFSLVMGRHVNHPDTSSLPFSYLIENSSGSYLAPGVNLKSVGTIRDAQKWPKRDKRTDSSRTDCINFNLLSPYTAGKMLGATELLDELERIGGTTAERYSYQALTIESRALRKGREYYSMAVDKFMGNSVIHRLGEGSLESDSAISDLLRPTHPAGRGEWVDLCGLLAPQSEVANTLEEIADGALDSLEAIEERWHQLHRDYYDMEWTWVVEHFEQWYGCPVTQLTRSDLVRIVERWRSSVVRLDNLLAEDARKEYSLKSRIGFGIDRAESAADDFERVRGNYESDPFVKMVADHITVKSALADRTLGRLLSGGGRS